LKTLTIKDNQVFAKSQVFVNDYNYNYTFNNYNYMQLDEKISQLHHSYIG